MIVEFKGVKCQTIEKINGENGPVFLNDFIEPAKDAFSRPSVFRVTSTTQAFQVGDVVDFKAELGAYVSRRTYTDKQNQPREYSEMKAYIRLIEEQQQQNPVYPNKPQQPAGVKSA